MSFKINHTLLEGINARTRKVWFSVENGALVMRGEDKCIVPGRAGGLWNDTVTGKHKPFKLATGSASELQKVCNALAGLFADISAGTHEKQSKSSERIAKLAKARKLEAERKKNGFWNITSEDHTDLVPDALAKEVSGNARKLFDAIAQHISPRGYVCPTQNGKSDGCLWEGRFERKPAPKSSSKRVPNAAQTRAEVEGKLKTVKGKGAKVSK